MAHDQLIDYQKRLLPLDNRFLARLSKLVSHRRVFLVRMGLGTWCLAFEENSHLDIMFAKGEHGTFLDMFFLDDISIQCIIETMEAAAMNGHDIVLCDGEILPMITCVSVIWPSGCTLEEMKVKLDLEGV